MSRSDRIYVQIEFVGQSANPVYMLTQECLVSQSTGYVCHQVPYLYTLKGVILLGIYEIPVSQSAGIKPMVA